MARMKLIGTAAAFLASPAGRQALRKAQSWATSPEGKAKIQQLRDKATDLQPGRGDGRPDGPPR